MPTYKDIIDKFMTIANQTLIVVVKPFILLQKDDGDKDRFVAIQRYASVYNAAIRAAYPVDVQPDESFQIHTDGIIFISAHTEYRKNEVYKWKSKDSSTIDFLLVRNEKGRPGDYILLNSCDYASFINMNY